MKEWQFNVLFFVGVGGAVLLLVGPNVGFEISSNPTALTGVGAILTYVLTRQMAQSKSDKKKKRKDPEEPTDKEVSDEPG